MNKELQKAKDLLEKENYTCVLCGKKVYSSFERGVKPLLTWYENGEDVRGYCVADKVVGRGAAFLYVLMGVSHLYAKVVSEGAKALLEKHGIELCYDKLVDAIRDRTGQGYCPIEQAVKEIDDPETALEAIKKRLRELSGK